jgi:hypothetical protein
LNGQIGVQGITFHRSFSASLPHRTAPHHENMEKGHRSRCGGAANGMDALSSASIGKHRSVADPARASGCHKRLSFVSPLD